MRKWYALIIALVLTADRLVKSWAQVYLSGLPGGTIPVIDGVFHLTYAQNEGASFGMLQGQFWLFYTLTAIAALILIWLLFIRPVRSARIGVVMALILGGALGNFYDRVFYRFVVDMFDLRLINFAIFNVADSALCVGIGLFILFTLLDERAQARANDTAGVKPDDGAQDNG